MQFLVFLSFWKILLRTITDLGDLVISSVLEILNKDADLLKNTYFGLSKAFALTVLLRLLILLGLHKLLQPFLFLKPLGDRAPCVLFHLGQHFFLCQVVLTEHVVIQDCTVVFRSWVQGLFVFLRLGDAVAVCVQVWGWPEIELLVLEKLFAVLFDAHVLINVWVAPIVVYNLVKLLLQFKSCLIHLFHREHLVLFGATEIRINVDVLVANVLLLERKKPIKNSPVDFVLVKVLEVWGAWWWRRLVFL